MLHRPLPYVSKTAIFAGQRTFREAAEKSPFNSKGLRRRERDVRACGKTQKQGAASITVAGENGIVSGMAGRYATALFELALETNSVEQVQSDLKAFDALVAANPDLTRLVRSPVFSADDQARALVAILEKAGIKGVAANFLRVVAANRRLFAVAEIIRGFNRLVAAHKGEVTAQVTVAEQLNDARMNEIRDALKQVTGKDVQIDVDVDPSIIGGIKVKVGSRMVDASLRTKLNSIKFAMKEAR
ncbi:MAG: F-type H+-transporting ATPase subunit delta [Hyphomicrobiales bacterium]|jgi:F-type H+-transporting ATPase subunit delta|nr:F-type H+-transporting ATPase subunit delta [Hyphomicrobiales bacterium]